MIEIDVGMVVVRVLAWPFGLATSMDSDNSTEMFAKNVSKTVQQTGCLVIERIFVVTEEGDDGQGLVAMTTSERDQIHVGERFRIQ